MNHRTVSRFRRAPVLALLCFVVGVGCLGLGLYHRNAQGAQQAAKQPFANSVQQRMEMIEQLKGINALLKEQNDLLKQQNELLRAGLPTPPPGAGKPR